MSQEVLCIETGTVECFAVCSLVIDGNTVLEGKDRGSCTEYMLDHCDPAAIYREQRPDGTVTTPSTVGRIGEIMTDLFGSLDIMREIHRKNKPF